MSDSQVLDLLDRAFDAGCFKEVLKLIRAGTDPIIIEKVIEKSAERQRHFDLDWSDLFGAD